MAIEKRFTMAIPGQAGIRLVFWCPDVNYADE